MNYFLPIHFTEATRSRVGVSLGIINWICIVASFALVGIGLFIKYHVNNFTNLVTGFDNQIMVSWTIIASVLALIINVPGGFCCFIAAAPQKREYINKFLITYVIMSAALSLMLLIAGVLCYISISKIENSLKGGIMNAMKKYSGVPHLKVELDELQMNYQCCGSNNYKDWFRITWIHEAHSSKPHTGVAGENVDIHDDIPFSCCSKTAMRPCIHTDIHTNEMHDKYDYTQHLTIYKIGCTEALVDYMRDSVLFSCGIFILTTFALQIVITVMVRYYQTSIYEALLTGEADSPTKGYLLKFDSGDTSLNPIYMQNDDELLPRAIYSNQSQYDDPRIGSQQNFRSTHTFVEDDVENLIPEAKATRSNFSRLDTHRSPTKKTRSSYLNTQRNITARRSNQQIEQEIPLDVHRSETKRNNAYQNITDIEEENPEDTALKAMFSRLDTQDHPIQTRESVQKLQPHRSRSAKPTNRQSSNGLKARRSSYQSTN